MIEENDFDLSRIVWIDDSSPNLDTMFDSESRTGGNSPVYSRWENNCDPRGDKPSLRRANNTLHIAVEVITHSAIGTTSRNNRIIRKLLDPEGHTTYHCIVILKFQ